MAEQKNKQDAVNVEDALSQSEAFIVKNKKMIISVIVAIIVIIAGVVIYKNFISSLGSVRLRKLYIEESNILMLNNTTWLLTVIH